MKFSLISVFLFAVFLSNENIFQAIADNRYLPTIFKNPVNAEQRSEAVMSSSLTNEEESRNWPHRATRNTLEKGQKRSPAARSEIEEMEEYDDRWMW
uniref:Venom protein 3.1 n=1 Tax=Lychas mucronatus TaxID=172552 RepID=NDBK_LYCMC|nr:RecName: Full=Venom protein 3.1; Flags: Precursor [Lychas mucronatus]